MEDLCKVPCPPVYKELQMKTPLGIFKWIVGGLGAAILLIALVMYNNQTSTWKVLTEILSDVKVVQAQMKIFNGRSRRGRGDRR